MDNLHSTSTSVLTLRESEDEDDLHEKEFLSPLSSPSPSEEEYVSPPPSSTEEEFPGEGEADERKTDEGEANESQADEGEDACPNVFVFYGELPETKANDCPPTFTTTYDLILDYLDEHQAEKLLEHLLALCLITMPDDPFEFMATHCRKLAEARNDPEKFKELTRVFYPKHVHAMYRLFDKEQNGHITLQQYKFAMQSFGLVRYTPEPKGYEKDAISEATFTCDACHALEVLLKSLMA